MYSFSFLFENYKKNLQNLGVSTDTIQKIESLPSMEKGKVIAFLIRNPKASIEDALNKQKKSESHEHPDPKIHKWILSADPTPKKDYYKIIWSWLNNKSVFVTDDYLNILKSVLDFYNKHKRKFKTSYISKYTKFGDLITDYESVVGEESNRQREENLKKEGAKFLGHGKKYDVWQLVTPVACSLYGKGTRWCTSSEDMARHYLNNGNMYVAISKSDPTIKFQVGREGYEQTITIRDDADDDFAGSGYSAPELEAAFIDLHHLVKDEDDKLDLLLYFWEQIGTLSTPDADLKFLVKHHEKYLFQPKRLGLIGKVLNKIPGSIKITPEVSKFFVRIVETNPGSYVHIKKYIEPFSLLQTEIGTIVGKYSLDHSIHTAVDYARDILKAPWSKSNVDPKLVKAIEQKIVSYDHLVTEYCNTVIGGRWVEMESTFRKSPSKYRNYFKLYPDAIHDSQTDMFKEAAVNSDYDILLAIARNPHARREALPFVQKMVAEKEAATSSYFVAYPELIRVLAIYGIKSDKILHNAIRNMNFKTVIEYLDTVDSSPETVRKVEKFLASSIEIDPFFVINYFINKTNKTLQRSSEFEKAMKTFKPKTQFKNSPYSDYGIPDWLTRVVKKYYIPFGVRAPEWLELAMNIYLAAEYANQFDNDGVSSRQENEHGIWEHSNVSMKGNQIWSILTWTNKATDKTIRCISLCLLERHNGLWCRKEMSEFQGPYYYNCPLRLLKLCPLDTSYEDVLAIGLADSWRKGVETYHREMNIGRKFEKGKTYSLVRVREDFAGRTVRIISTKPLIGDVSGRGEYKIRRKMIGDEVVV